jgi:hypothetical protein
MPLRDEEELKKLIQVRYPALINDVEKVFIKTGGVGRKIDELHENKDQSCIVNELCKPAFRAVANRLFLKNEGRGQDLVETTIAMTYSEITYAMKPYVREEEFMNQLNEWVDAGLLYANNTDYELLLPSSYETMKAYFKEYPDRLNMMALEGTLRQWDGCGSAGGLNEKYITKRLVASQGEYSLPFKILACNQRCLSVTAKESRVPFTDAPNLCGELLYFAADQGFDGVVFEKGANTTLKIHAIQIKTGGIKKRITLGGPSGEAEGRPDIILGIMKCANDAAISLSEQMKKTKIQCEFASFSLVTNKEVAVEAKKAFANSKLMNKPVKTYLIDKETFYAMFTEEVLTELGMTNIKADPLHGENSQKSGTVVAFSDVTDEEPAAAV